MTELFELGREIIALVRDNELQRAAARAKEAATAQSRVCVRTRGDQIHHINRALHKLKEICADLRSAVQDLPANERLFAEVQVQQVIERHFAIEMRDLRRQKRGLSRPR